MDKQWTSAKYGCKDNKYATDTLTLQSGLIIFGKNPYVTVIQLSQDCVVVVLWLLWLSDPSIIVWFRLCQETFSVSVNA